LEYLSRLPAKESLAYVRMLGLMILFQDIGVVCSLSSQKWVAIDNPLFR
jgi:ABC-type polysaccharide transport system permease subunit